MGQAGKISAFLSDLNSDKQWKWFNEDLEKFMKSGDFWRLGSTYYEMAVLVENEGKDGAYLRNLGYKIKLKVQEGNLRDIEKSDAVNVLTGVEITACSNSCELCKGLNGKRFSIEDAKKYKPLPVRACAYECGCRCAYAPTVE